MKNVETPKIGPNEVLVRIHVCGVCHTDVGIFRGYIKTAKTPIILGHEVAGEIEKVGSQVEGLKASDRVVVSWVYSACGECYYCRTGFENLCNRLVRTGIDTDGGYAEYIRAPASSILRIPSSLSFEEGAILSDAVATPYHAITRISKISMGETVAVFGVGGLGMNAVQLSKLCGANVIAIDIAKDKLDIAKNLGADAVINARETDPIERIMDITDQVGVDVALEMVGSKPTVTQALNCVRKKGRVVIVGVYTGEVVFNPFHILVNEIKVLGSRAFTRQDQRDVMELARRRKIQVAPLITHRIRINEINDGIMMLETGETPDGRSLVRMVATPN
jgi:2-desacetyl-2-hydroxyethyl bacteriochlorophyllide A dehydrogenase